MTEQEISNFTNTKTFPNTPPGSSIWIILLIVSTIVISEFLSHLFLTNHPLWTSILLPPFILIVTLLSLKRNVLGFLSSKKFLYACLVILALSTIVAGVLFLSKDQLKESSVLIYLHGYNSGYILNSTWYLSLVSLFGAGIVASGFSKKKSIGNLPYLLGYLGIILIIAGFILNSFLGWQGILLLDNNELQNTIQIYKRNSTEMEGQAKLPFYLRLDEFKATEIPPDFEIQVLENSSIENPHANVSPSFVNVPEESALLASFSLEPDKIRRVPGTDVYFRLKEFYPNFGFKYDYPERTDDIDPVDPGIMCELIYGGKRFQLQLRTRNKNTLTEPHMNVSFEFYWEVPDDLISMPVIKDLLPMDTAFQRLVFIGSTEEALYIYDRGFVMEKLVRNRDYFLNGKRDIGFHYQFVFPDAKLISAKPSSINDELINPAAKLEVWRKGTTGSEFSYVYAGKNGPGGFFALNNENRKLGLGSSNDNEARLFQSGLSIIDSTDRKLVSKEISKDVSLKYGGFQFSARSASRGSIDFPGINVRFERGLFWVYLGISCLILSGLGLFFWPLMPVRNSVM